MFLPEVATWVTVLQDQRKSRNQLRGLVPCVVSKVAFVQNSAGKVDPAKSRINVLFPNALSLHMHESDQTKPLLWAIEGYPLEDIRPYDGNVEVLDKVLKKALLHFVEDQGRGRKHGSAININVGSKVLGEQQPKTIKVGLMNLAADKGTTAGIPGCRVVGDGLGAGLEKFVVVLNNLFNKEGQTKLAKDYLASAFSTEYPDWEEFISVLTSQNTNVLTPSGRFRFFEAEQLIFRVEH